MKTFATLIATSLLAGCATTPSPSPEPIIITQEVRVPVAGTCVPADLPAEPTYPDTRAKLLGAKDAAERYQLMGAGWPLRDQRLKELEIAVAGCPKAEKKE